MGRHFVFFENFLSLFRVKKRGTGCEAGGDGGTSMGFELLEGSGAMLSENGDSALRGFNRLYSAM